MITSSGLQVSATSLMKRYIMRRRLELLDWKSLVTPKNTSVVSARVSWSPCSRHKRGHKAQVRALSFGEGHGCRVSPRCFQGGSGLYDGMVMDVDKPG